MPTFQPATRVIAIVGGVLRSGAVRYVRMAGPDYREPAAYSVYLDHRAADPLYAGTIVGAERVSLETLPPSGPAPQSASPTTPGLAGDDGGGAVPTPEPRKP